MVFVMLDSKQRTYRSYTCFGELVLITSLRVYILAMPADWPCCFTYASSSTKVGVQRHSYYSYYCCRWHYPESLFVSRFHYVIYGRRRSRWKGSKPQIRPICKKNKANKINLYANFYMVTERRPLNTYTATEVLNKTHFI